VAVAVDDHHAVRGALEEAGVALEELDTLFGLDASARALLGFVAQGLQKAGVSEGDRRGVRERRGERELGVAEQRARLGTQEQDAERPALVVHDRQERKRGEAACRFALAHDLEQRAVGGVLDHERPARGDDLADLRVLIEHDRAVADAVVVARGEHEAHAARLRQ
jgi:hypothetical protein